MYAAVEGKTKVSYSKHEVAKSRIEIASFLEEKCVQVRVCVV